MRFTGLSIRTAARLVAALALSLATPLAAQGGGHAYGRVGQEYARDRDYDRYRSQQERWDRDRDDRGRNDRGRAAWEARERAIDRAEDAALRRRYGYDRREYERLREAELRRQYALRYDVGTRRGRNVGACVEHLPDGRPARTVWLGGWKTVKVPC